MKNKNIVISTYTYLPDIGGVAKNKLTLINALLDRGYTVKVVTNTSACLDQPDSRYEIIRTPSPFELFKLYRWADIILFSNLSIKLCWPFLFSSFSNAKLGLHHHSSSAFNRVKTKNVIKTWIEDRVINNSVHYVNSEYTIKNGGDFFTGLPVEVTYPISSHSEITQSTKDIFCNKKDAIFVGRIAVEKGPGFLVEHFAEIKSHLGINKLYLAGDGEMLDSLVKIAPEGVIFLGAIPLDDVYKKMEECEYVFVPSIWNEPFGNVAVEGVSAGAIVISSNNGGLPEACGDVGLLFDFSEQDGFNHALIEAKALRVKLLQSEPKREEYFENVNKHLSKFKADNIIDIIQNSLNKI